MRSHAIAVDLLVVLAAGLPVALVLGPFLNLLFGLPGSADAAAGDTWRLGAGTSWLGTLLGPLLAGAVWFSIRRHRAVHLDKGDPAWRPRRWVPYGVAVSATAALVPLLGIQLLVWFVFGHVS